MTRLYVQKQHNSLVPTDEFSEEVLDELPFGKIIEVEVRYKRSIEHNALFWVMCKKIAAATGNNYERVADNFLIETGRFTQEFVKPVGEGEGHWLIRLDSRSFDKMDQTEFNEFFRECVAIAYDKWGIPTEELEPILQEHENGNRVASRETH